MAKDSTEKLNTLVDDLLDLAKFAKGRLRMNFELTYLDELVRRAVEKYGPAFQRAAGEGDHRAAAVRAAACMADPNRVNQVLNNLLTNAVKFTPEGGEVTLELRATSALPGFVALSCWNSGEPIAEESLERIFDRFEQARTPSNRTVRGTGLGLAICRHIVEAHGGRIWCEPSSQGVRFVTVLPIEPPQELRARRPPRLPCPLAKRPEPRGRVLVIEGETELAYIIKGAAARAAGYDVRIVTSAEEGISSARRHHPDVILVAVRLPDVDGPAPDGDPPARSGHPPHAAAASTPRSTSASARSAPARTPSCCGPLMADKLLATVDSLVRGRTGQQHGRVLVVDDDREDRRHLQRGARQPRLRGVRGGLAGGGPPRAARAPAGRHPAGRGAAGRRRLRLHRGDQGRARQRPHLRHLHLRPRARRPRRSARSSWAATTTSPSPSTRWSWARGWRACCAARSRSCRASPTTQLPGSNAIEREVQRRLMARQPFAFCYLDLDNLKAYNDYYGFAKADGVVRQTGDLLREIFAQEGAPGDFLGHVAGDDFVFITAPESVDRICQRAIEAFDRIIPLYYDRQDRERGHIEAEDRFGEKRKFPIMSVSIVAVMSDGMSHDHAELARRAADMKKRAKAVQGSIYLRSDREQETRIVTG